MNRLIFVVNSKSLTVLITFLNDTCKTNDFRTLQPIGFRFESDVFLNGHRVDPSWKVLTVLLLIPFYTDQSKLVRFFIDHKAS